MSSRPNSEEIHAGQAVYSPGLLRWYDLLVLGVSNRWIWRCPTPRLLELYNRHLSADHLEVGVGTGYFLDHARFPTASPHLVLTDLNPHCLDATRQRVSRYAPQTFLHDVFEPFPKELGRFDSIGLNYVLHCLPGEHRLVLQNLGQLLNPGGVLFGSTILAQGVPRSPLARLVMKHYNRRGIFSNLSDSPESLHAALAENFPTVQIDLAGCVARFTAHV